MTTSNKILTVSYGTFSCTLEGFDDAFGTMKAIAEYFRDLAAEDRYFGAEPPTPDAEMLARIAEREIERRVEARLHGDEVRLRPKEALPEPAAEPAPLARPHPAGMPEGAGRPDTPAAWDDAAAEEEEIPPPEAAATEAAAPEAEPSAPEAEAPETESLADKLRRIREVAAQEAEEVTEAEFIEDEHAEPLETGEEAWPEAEPEDVGAGVAELAPETDAPDVEEAPEPIEADIDEALLVRGDLRAAEEEEARVAGEPESAPLRLDRAAEEGVAEEPHAADGPGQDEQPRPEERLPDSAESEIDRLMEKTASVLREPSGRKRRNAISQLRAALLATREDTALAAGEDTEATSQPYRADLEAAVRPRRPNLPKETAAAQSRPRPGAGRPAPLRLVAEQRIDTPAPPAVRPRRISTAAVMVEVEEETSTPVAEGSFAAFVEEVGATELSEVIEAAATYFAQVEGREEFTRPELMARVREVMGELPREEALRQFGRLLREGKILQTSGGRFAASDRIGYMSGGRAAG